MRAYLTLAAIAGLGGPVSFAAELVFGPETPLTEIRAAVREARAKSPDAVAVVLRDGIYRVESALELTAEDSGTEASPVIWRAEHPGRAVLTAENPMAIGVPVQVARYAGTTPDLSKWRVKNTGHAGVRGVFEAKDGEVTMTMTYSGLLLLVW